MSTATEEIEVPFIFGNDDAVSYIEGIDFTPSPEWVERFGARLGRNKYPELLVDLAWYDRLSPEALTQCVPSAWAGAEHLQRLAEEAGWLRLFEDAGYTKNWCCGSSRSR